MPSGPPSHLGREGPDSVAALPPDLLGASAVTLLAAPADLVRTRSSSARVRVPQSAKPAARVVLRQRYDFSVRCDGPSLGLAREVKLVNRSTTFGRLAIWGSKLFELFIGLRLRRQNGWSTRQVNQLANQDALYPQRG
jgi:hypothetical protein